MICFIALPIFLLLSLFSAKYRPLARAAFECTFRRLTLRPCQADLETQVRTSLVGWLLPRFPPAAQFMHRHFELLGNLFTLLMLLSAAYTLFGLYNFVTYGTCDPADPSAFCLYRDVLGGGASANLSSLIPPNNSIGIVSGNANAPVTVIEFGCLTCPYTKAAEGAVSELLQQRGSQIRYVFKPFPLPNHNYSRQASLALLCAAQPAPEHVAPASNLSSSSSYWAYRAGIFARQLELAQNGTIALREAAVEAHLSPDFYSCLNSSEERYGAYLDARIGEGKSSKIYGTPTFFILASNYSKPLVGPVPSSQLISAVDEALAKTKG